MNISWINYWAEVLDSAWRLGLILAVASWISAFVSGLGWICCWLDDKDEDDTLKIRRLFIGSVAAVIVFTSVAVFIPNKDTFLKLNGVPVEKQEVSRQTSSEMN